MSLMRKISVKIVSMIIGIIMLTTLSISIVVAIGNNNNNKHMLETLETTMRESYDVNIKQQVENAISMLDAVNKRYEKGEITLNEAKEIGANSLRSLRYGSDGYFWADTEEGVNIISGEAKVEGTNRMDAVDANGYAMIKDIIANGMKEGGGYTDFYFPKNGETTPLPKRGYSLEFKPFKWIIGTGNYTNDIDEVITAKEQILNDNLKNSLMILIVIIVAIIIGASIFASNSIKKIISQYIDN